MKQKSKPLKWWQYVAMIIGITILPILFATTQLKRENYKPKKALLIIEHTDGTAEAYDVTYNEAEGWAEVHPTDSIPFWMQ